MTRQENTPRYQPFGAALSIAVGLVLVSMASGAGAEERRVGAEARTALTLTLYDRDLAQVSERRRIALEAGGNALAIEDVSRALKPETVLLRGQGLRVVEQVFAFDLITPRALVEAAVGKDVRLIKTHPRTGEETVLKARVLGIAEGPVLQVGDRIETTVPGRIAFDRLPEGLRERPTLIARIEVDAAGEAELELTYLTGGLGWRVDYVAELNAAEDGLALTGLVMLTNRSGTDFADATLRLVAGEVAREPVDRPLGDARVMGHATAALGQAAPAPRSVGDRYVYTLERPVTLADRESKRVILFDAPRVEAVKEYRFETLARAAPGPEKIGPVNAAVTLKVANEGHAGLGQPLPAGIVRVYQAATPGGALFIGEDRIRHTAEGEEMELTLGRAFDVTGEAKRTAFERLSNRSYETAQEITIRNAKVVPVSVRLIGVMPPGWRMLSETARHERETANRIVWVLPVPPKGEAKLEYRVRVSQ